MIAHRGIGAHGRTTFTVTDRNGSNATRYHAHVAATKATEAATTRTISVR